MDKTKHLSETEASPSPVEGAARFWPETETASRTERLQGPAEGSTGFPESHPSRIGRYRILRPIGRGGFGRVYLAHDVDLDRPVAIKVPNPDRITGAEDVEAFVMEARILARLDHPNIVPVFDVGRTEDGLCFVVSKLIEGSDLAVRIGQARPSFPDAAELVATIADALHYAHTRGLVHRDVKPANILIDASGKPCVADFGLALKDEDFGKGGRLGGTPAYMSPEQARGEGHRVDGRSDIFSLGVVFYELLTGRRPFLADTIPETIERVSQAEARPPRQIDDRIPKELERICLKAISRRASERYTTARDMAEDLRLFSQTAGGEVSPVGPAVRPPAPGSNPEADSFPLAFQQSDYGQRSARIVPKGLRSFDEHDTDFFMGLLPGPRDRDGLPASIRFWKRQIEQTDPDETFKVGLIYGPSGCGKSSLVKAGLLPRLAKHVHRVYIEATPGQTEARLFKGLRKACPGWPQGSGLVVSLAELRRGRILPANHKLLLVLDQFEQWLSARRGEQDPELVAALRHCDGQHLQAVVMVRDDFWMAATRFMRDLEIRLLEGENSAAVDLFDLDHARRVLAAFGRAFGRLPENLSETSREQKDFLKQSVDGLAQEGKVIPVRLALYSEMMKGKPWAPSTLKEVGGTKGVGVTFLEETFGASTAPPEHRLHQKAAQRVLEALLPENGTDIKGRMRSRQELLDASGYSSRLGDFDDLIRILDPELRLITPTDPSGKDEGGRMKDEPEGEPPAIPGSHSSLILHPSSSYQLTHDYLVHSLRDWLTRKQRETRRGRAELRLAERSADWNARPENRHLPSVLEWVIIRSLTRKKDWLESQRRMMKRAGRLYGLRAAGLLVLVALFSWTGAEGYGRLRASALVEALSRVATPNVPAVVQQLSGYRRWADPLLARVVQGTDGHSREHLHASLALLPVDASQADYLLDRLLNAGPGELPVLRDALKPHRNELTSKLWSVLDSARPGDVSLLPAASALADYDAANPRWESARARVAQALVSVNPVFLGAWVDALRPIRGKLDAPLAAIFRDGGSPDTERTLATNILADYASDDPERIADLLMDAGPKRHAAFFPIAQRQSAKTVPLFEAEIARKPTIPDTDAASEMVKDRLAERQARAAITLLRMGRVAEVIPLLRHGADPRLRSFIINWLEPLGADPYIVAAELDRVPQDPGRLSARRRPSMDAVLFDPETSTRRALILALGTFGAERLSPGERERLLGKLLDLYRDDPDSGIHGAAEWVLRKWGQQEKLREVDARLMKIRTWGDRRWFVNGQGQTFAVIGGPVEFRMGSPPAEPDHEADEPLRVRTIPHRFAVAAKEVTIDQYERFVQSGNPGFGVDRSYLDKHSPDPNAPRIAVGWFGAAAYCNWLSKQEGVPESQWCYLPNERGEYDVGMTIPADVLKRTGYRLPAEVEWEYACRAGAITSRYYGLSVDLLGAYGRYAGNGGDRAWPCGGLLPNDLGLFDMLGNVYEWCQERAIYPQGSRAYQTDDILDLRNVRVLRGGAFNYPSMYVRSANRSGNLPADGAVYLGFRVARTCD